MKPRKGVLMLLMAAMVLSMYLTPVLATTSVSNLWSDPTLQGSASYDYYERIATTSFWDPWQNRHIGRVDVVYKVEYIVNDDSSYDYYGVYVQETVTPSLAMSGSDHDAGYIIRGVTYFKLRDSDQIVKDILPRSGTTGTNTYGIGCRVGNGDADFTTTGTLSVPQVFVSGYHSSIYGSTDNWCQFRCDETDTRDDSNRYRFTCLVKVREGQDVYMNLVIKTSWRSYDGWGFPISCDYAETIAIQVDGTPFSGGGGGGGHLFT
ncbi:hypothetical protein EU538_05640 [Candidatus Thorarchaeota archaeon]|nr:MAG: hypothetical protein EU538_05640 [Candidatus Thorarchaeota archaeon]